MKSPNVKDLNTDAMLERSEVTTGILRAVHALKNIDDYKKEDAANELVRLLCDRGYLDHPLEIKEGNNHGK